MVEYIWKINYVDSIASQNNYFNVVKKVYWRLLATDGIKTVETTGITELLPYEEGQPFTEHEEIDKNVIIEWIKLALGETKVKEIESELLNQLQTTI